MVRTYAVCAQFSMETINGLVLLKGLHYTGWGSKDTYSILSAWDLLLWLHQYMLNIEY